MKNNRRSAKGVQVSLLTAVLFGDRLLPLRGR
jgi:hypothetical protein